MADLPEIVSRLAAALRAAGLSPGPDRVAAFARAITLVDPASLPQLRAVAHATLTYEHAHLATLDRVFDAVFIGFTDPADQRGQAGNEPALAQAKQSTFEGVKRMTAGQPGTDSGEPKSGDVPVPTQASDLERLQHKDFSELSAAELATLAQAMAALRLATPLRRSRRTRPRRPGRRLDLRATLRLAQRTGGDPVHLVRRQRRMRPRRLVVLCDISGSMEPYARAMVQLLYCATVTTKAEVFTFATRLTRITPVLASQNPARALARAGQAAPDWSGGTKIGAAVEEVLDRYGRAGMARGAVLMIVSDGWETGDPALLGRQMRRLSRLAYRIVWVNPRSKSATYQPLVGGMAAAWPYCDAVVSAHSLDAVGDLTRALREH